MDEPQVYATPEIDFQIPQAVPAEVWAAYEGLVASGCPIPPGASLKTPLAFSAASRLSIWRVCMGVRGA